jgi:hypothetical protein
MLIVASAVVANDVFTNNVFTNLMTSYLSDLERELDAAIAGATAGALEKAPAVKWSTRLILEHLYLSYVGTNRALAKCLNAGKPLGTVPTIKQRLGTFVVTGLGYFPEGVKSPAVAVPRGVSPEEVGQNIFMEIQKMAVGFDECEQRFGGKTKILDHPILGPLNAKQWRKLHLLHGRHHIRQIRERVKM